MFGEEGKAAGARLVDTYMKTVFPSPWEDTWDTEYKSGGGGLETDFQVWPTPNLFQDLSWTGGGTKT